MNTLTYVRVDVDFVAVPTPTSWVAEGRLVDQSPDSRDGLTLLCDADGGVGFFELRLADGSVFQVSVERPGPDGRIEIREGWPT